MKTNDLNERLKKEKELYNHGIDRSWLASVLNHVASGPGNIRLFENMALRCFKWVSMLP
jgi:hypothetical protein